MSNNKTSRHGGSRLDLGRQLLLSFEHKLRIERGATGRRAWRGRRASPRRARHRPRPAAPEQAQIPADSTHTARLRFCTVAPESFPRALKRHARTRWTKPGAMCTPDTRPKNELHFHFFFFFVLIETSYMTCGHPSTAHARNTRLI